MVRGNWIISVKGMRCKNWVNGVEISFSVGRDGTPAGVIHYVPRELIQQIPLSVDRVLYLYRLWHCATRLFRRAYYCRQACRKREASAV